MTLCVEFRALWNLLTPFRQRFPAQIFLLILCAKQNPIISMRLTSARNSLLITYFVYKDQLLVLRVVGKEENPCFCGIII